SNRPNWPWWAPTFAAIAGAGPIVAIALYNLASTLVANPPVGPEPSSIFARMGTATSYACPIFMLAQVFALYAIRERLPGFALAGGAALNLAATIGWLLMLADQGLQFDAPTWIRLAQLNAAVAAVYAMGWLGMLWRAARQGGPGEPIAPESNYSI